MDDQDARGGDGPAGGWGQRPTPPPEPAPPHLPWELHLPDGAGEVLQLLQGIWLRANPDTIGTDLDRARRLAAEASPAEAELAGRYVNELARLERWLRDV